MKSRRWIYKQFLKSCAVLLLLLCSILSQSGVYRMPEQKSREKKTVLLLFAFSHDMPYIDMAMKSIRRTFERSAADIDIEILYEFMSVDQMKEEEHLHQLLNLYAIKYHSKKIDLVFMHQRQIIDFWIEHRHTIFSEVPPVIVYDIQPETYAAQKDSVDITGVILNFNYKNSIEWFLKEHPFVNKIIIVKGVGVSDTGVIRMKPLEELKKRFGNRVQFVDWSSLSFAEMKQKAEKLSRNNVIFYLAVFEDAAGIKYRPYDAVAELASVSSVPILSCYSHFVGTGIIGGYVFSIEEATELATLKGIRILKGEPFSSVPISSDMGNHFIFDHEALLRYDISLSSIPPESIIKNYQYNLWERHRNEIITIISGFIFLGLLIIFLVILSKRLNKARLDLRNLNANLEVQVGYRTEQLRAINNALTDEVAERRHIEENLVVANSQLKALNDAKDKFLSIIAHDLRSPISTTIGFSDLLIADLHSFDSVKLMEVLKIINAQSESTLSLLDNLLSWARSQAGQISYEPEKNLLSEIILDIIQPLNSAASLKDISIKNLLTDKVEIYADQNMLKTVLRNLISNSIKFTNQGGKIIISGQMKKDNFEISILDNGVGMSKETQEKLFGTDLNFTTRGTADEKGSGLGLILCKDFVEKHGGKIWVESEPGKGSNFKVLLPVNLYTPE